MAVPAQITPSTVPSPPMPPSPPSASPSASGEAIPPVVCDMTNDPDTLDERMGEYRALFESALIARERTVAGFRWRFRADDGVESRVRALAAKDQVCCAFFAFTITPVGGEVLWDAAVVDDDMARSVLEEYFLLPETMVEGSLVVQDRFAATGLRVYIDDGGGLRLATADELAHAGMTASMAGTSGAGESGVGEFEDARPVEE